MNAGTQIGVGWAPATNGGGIRQSSAVGYLHSNGYIDRPNLDVLIGAQVVKLVYAPITSGSPSTPVVAGVQYASGPFGTVYTAKASKEVVLSAGSVGTPQILLLSGIGPKSALQSVGIASVKDIPDVGQKLQVDFFSFFFCSW